VSRLGTIGIGIVLARLLGPSEFGTFAVAYVALTAALSFNELGVSLAIVRWPDHPRAIAPTVSTISLLSSIVICGLLYLIAPSFSSAMGDPGATGVVRLLALSVIVSGAVATPASLMQREFRQDTKMFIDQVNAWLGAAVSIVLALIGIGAVSLAVGRLAGAVVSGILFIVYSPEPYRLGWDRTKVRSLLRFGLPLAGASLVVLAVGYVDQIVAGRILGATALGLYVLAANLANWPVNLFSQPLRSVAPATFARLQNDSNAMRTTLRSLVGLLAAVTLPVCLLLAGAAKPLVRFVYGPEWEPAASALAWLAMLAALRIFYELAYDYFVVLGWSKSILLLQVVWLVALIPALIYGAKGWGIAGIGAGHVVVAACIVLPIYMWQFLRAGVRPRELLNRVWLTVIVASSVGLMTAGLGRIIQSSLLSLLVSGVLALVAIGALLYRDRTQLFRLRGSTLSV
jgi:PST family polysaccharide transporter